MLISHRHRFIYTKTFKTGGTSVEAYFEPWCMAPGEWRLAHERDESDTAFGVIGFRGANPPPGLRWWNHMTAAEIRQRTGDKVWNTYFKFCVVRNPYDRAVSAFYFDRSKGRLPPSAEADPVQFEQWLARGAFRMDRAQYLGDDGRLVVDDVLRYEHLQDELERLCTRIGLPWEPERLPRFKAGIRPPGASMAALYTPRAEALVAHQCAIEIEVFGYTLAEAATAVPLAA